MHTSAVPHARASRESKPTINKREQRDRDLQRAQARAAKRVH